MVLDLQTRLAAFKLEGDALSWWKAHLRTQVADAARNIELLHESGIEMVIGFRTRDRVNRRSGLRRSIETLPPPPLCATYGKPHPGV
nr:zinc finger, CCHC-type, retrotransposon Gag domain protein [Tanacetum cinerariifolium]